MYWQKKKPGCDSKVGYQGGQQNIKLGEKVTDAEIQRQILHGKSLGSRVGTVGFPFGSLGTKQNMKWKFLWDFIQFSYFSALGFVHMHNAHNRDKYVEILWDNIEPGYEHCFEALSATDGTNFGYEYDYTSVLHFDRKAYSKNGEDTIRTNVSYLKLIILLWN